MRHFKRSRDPCNSSTPEVSRDNEALLRWMALVLGVVLCAACVAQTPKSHDGPATLELKRLVAANPELKRLLSASIERAKQVNPDRLTNPAQSLDQYYYFVSYAERAMPGSLLKAKADATLYQRTDQSVSYLLFIANQPLKELEGRGYFDNCLQYAEPYSSW